MYLKHLSLTNFRNFARLDLDLPRRVIVLVGSNAQGKTSLLEAVYFMAAFTSFQTHADRQLVNFIAAREARKQVVVGRLVADYQRGKSDHRLEARLIMEPTGVTERHTPAQRSATGWRETFVERGHRTIQCGRFCAADVTDFGRWTG